MNSFLVLGIIPGTNIQTNLNFWLTVYTLILTIMFRSQIVQMRSRIQTQIIAWRIAHAIDSCELVVAPF